VCGHSSLGSGDRIFYTPYKRLGKDVRLVSRFRGSWGWGTPDDIRDKKLEHFCFFAAGLVICYLLGVLASEHSCCNHKTNTSKDI
jgi:hypothetical protein